jgi:disulfide bond formation protein DsbB
MMRAILSAFGSAQSTLPLIVIAAVFGVLLAISFRFTTPQRRLRRVADLARAELLAIKLFKNDPIVVMKSFCRLLGYSALRILYGVPSLIIMLPLSLAVIAQLALWYEQRPLHMGETAVVEIQVNEDEPRRLASVSLRAPDNVAVETLPLRDFQSQTASWRIKATNSGGGVLHFQLGGETAEKSIVVAEADDDFIATSGRRAGPGLWDRLMNPAEAHFKSHDPLRSAEIVYPRRDVPLFGWSMPWWAVCFAAACIAALAVKPFVGVQF